MKTVNERILFFINFLSAGFMYLMHLYLAEIGIYEPASLTRMLEGSAYRPFAYRVLIPQLSKLLSLLPFELSFAHVPFGILRWTFAALHGDLYYHEAAWTLVLIFLSMLGFLYAAKAFLSDLGYSAESSQVLPIFMLFLSVLFSANFGYVYDMPQLFLMTVSYIFLYRRRWIIYLLLFSLATLNKETSVLLIVLYAAFYFGKLERNQFLKLLSWQSSIYMLVRAALFVRFYQNPNFFDLKPALPKFFGSPMFAARISMYQEHLWILFGELLVVMVIVWIVRMNWDRKNEFLRVGTLVPLTLFFLYLWGGHPTEIRVFHEAIPILSILLFDPEKL